MRDELVPTDVTVLPQNGSQQQGSKGASVWSPSKRDPLDSGKPANEKIATETQPANTALCSAAQMRSRRDASEMKSGEESLHALP